MINQGLKMMMGGGKIVVLPSTPVINTGSTVVYYNKIYISWSAISNATLIYIYVSPNANFSNLISGTSPIVMGGGTATYYTIENLSANTFFYIKVQGSNSQGNGQASQTVQYLTKISPPIITSLTIDQGFVTCNWEAAVDAERYMIKITSSYYGQIGLEENIHFTKSWNTDPGDTQRVDVWCYRYGVWETTNVYTRYIYT